MKMMLLIFVFIFTSSTLLVAQDAEKRAMTVDDVLDIANVGDALISPDGNWVFYSNSTLNWEENKLRDPKYYMIPATGGEAFQFIGEGGSPFAFSPDGKFLTFIRTVEKESQIFLIRVSGGEAFQLTKHKNSVGSYKWSADSKKIFFIADEPRSDEEERRYQAGYDMIFVDEGPVGQRSGSWSNLWVYDLESQEEERITDEKFIVTSFDPSPDARRIVYSARYSNRRNDPDKNELYILTLATKEKTRLTENNTPEGEKILWAPDGKSFVYTAKGDKEWLHVHTKLWLMNPNTKEYRLLTGGFDGGNITEFYWSPDSRKIYFNAQQRTNTNLLMVDVGTGEISQVTDVKGTLRIGNMSKDRTRFVYTFSDFDTPGDVYVSSVQSFSPVRLTDANPWVEKELLLADMKLVQWKSTDDFEIEGLLHLPPGYVAGSRLPFILNIHGDPGSYTNSFSPHYHVFGGLGYVSLSPNIRGSLGYGDHFFLGNTIAQDDGYCLGDYDDLMNGVDYVIEEGYVDEDRMGIKGWSYGGILGGWVITQTDRFKAASLGAGVYDWPSEYGMGYNWDVRLWYIGGTPWDNPEAWRYQSPLTHVKNVVTPTLLIHGEEDIEDTEQQSLMFFTAIKDIGKAPARYIVAPREGHNFVEARHKRTMDIVEIQWLQKYILGLEWEAPERKEDKK